MISSASGKRIHRTLAVAWMFGLGACSNIVERVTSVGEAPDLAPIENPVLEPEYKPISLPMPAPETPHRHPNSLWRTGARGFFLDQRAREIGDIPTVFIDIEDEANIDNSTRRTRDNEEDASFSGFFGYESNLSQVFPEGIDPDTIVDLSRESDIEGTGEINRTEEINLRVAAIVTQVLPNGNLVIQGTQEVRVNFEVRELRVLGVVRPEDISADNTVRHDQIAEARITYGGRGQITDVQQPPYGQQLFDIFYPF